MSLTIEQLANGLTPAHDYFFEKCPEDPNVRESMSVWLYEDNGEFAFPRVAIEAQASSWDNRGVQGNIAYPGGKILNGGCIGPAHSPIDAQGRPSILGAGPLTFHCIDPFRTWRMVFDGTAAGGTIEQQIEGTLDFTKRKQVKLDVELTSAVPSWVQDNTPEAIAKMSEADAIEASYMGIGWRYERLFRAAGTFEVDGVTRDFKGSGIQVKRQSVRPMGGFRGHCWQSALFPDGRGFSYVTYPPRENGAPAFNDAFIYLDGKTYPAKVTKIPWLERITTDGEDVSLELQSELGTTRINAVSAFTTYLRGNTELQGLDLYQGGALYEWDGQKAYGMMERSGKAAPYSKG